ncbi:hypothetical protein OH77DRAFT_1014594 [Trametes cingulata]|nr:hypothetical protein OH77DRAFT_1014594 [Trametes cingulata]
MTPRRERRKQSKNCKKTQREEGREGRDHAPRRDSLCADDALPSPARQEHGLQNASEARGRASEVTLVRGGSSRGRLRNSILDFGFSWI